MYPFWRNFIFNVIMIIFQLSFGRYSVVRSITLSNVSTQNHNIDLDNVTHGSTKCVIVDYDLKDAIPVGKNDLLLKSWNITLRASQYKLENGSIFGCMPLHPRMENLPALNCSEKFEYKKEEFLILPNGLAIIGKYVVPAEEYELDGDFLLTCVSEEPVTEGKITLERIYIYVGQIGSIISIVSLVVHLCTFAFMPSLRNLPGYNLASLSVAFLLAYLWVIIGRIRQVRGIACIVSAVLQQNFFLAAFFCTNVLAFDVFRMLKSTTERLVVGSRSSQKRRFLWYSMYAWGLPAVITAVSVVVDNSDGVPEVIKPDYGKHNLCVMVNRTATGMFFVAPAFTLILVNTVFFVWSSCIISSSKMKFTQDQTKQHVTFNYFLYLRLAIMMGVTWLLGIIALIAHSEKLWFVFDLLNSLQGLFLLLFFTCTKKVLKQLSPRSNIFELHSTKRRTLTSNLSSNTDISEMKLSRSNSLA